MLIERSTCAAHERAFGGLRGTSEASCFLSGHVSKPSLLAYITVHKARKQMATEEA